MRKQGYNALHLCVYFDQPNWIDELKDSELLKNEKCNAGITPVILSMWLNRKTCLEKLNTNSNHKIKITTENETKYLTVNELEKFFGIEYLPYLEFESPKLLNKVLKRIQKANKKNKIFPEEKWLGAYYKENIDSSQLPDIHIKWIDFKKGYGLFADKDIKKKKWIGHYTGLVRNSTPKKDQKNAYCFEYVTGYKYPENFTIDAKQKGNYTRFINHSYRPNLKPSLLYYGSILLIAFLTNRDIKKGEELTYDYGPDYWKKREKPN